MSLITSSRLQLYSKQEPWAEKKTRDDLRKALLEDGHPPRPKLLDDDALWAVVKRCCNPEPKDRGDTETLYRDMRRIAPIDLKMGYVADYEMLEL